MKKALINKLYSIFFFIDRQLIALSNCTRLRKYCFLFTNHSKDQDTLVDTAYIIHKRVYYSALVVPLLIMDGCRVLVNSRSPGFRAKPVKPQLH